DPLWRRGAPRGGGAQPIVLRDGLPVLAVLVLGGEERPAERHGRDEHDRDGGRGDGEAARAYRERAEAAPRVRDEDDRVVLLHRLSFSPSTHEHGVLVRPTFRLRESH